LLSDVVSSLKAEISTITENIGTENSRLAKNITSNLTAKFKEGNQKFSVRLAEQFHAKTCKLKEELTFKIQTEVTNLTQAI
jgi:hypothetical protein